MTALERLRRLAGAAMDDGWAELTSEDIHYLIVDIEQRYEKEERLIGAGERIADAIVRYGLEDQFSAKLAAYDEAVADLRKKEA